LQSRIMNGSLIVAGFLIPLFIILVSYSLIFSLLSKRRKALQVKGGVFNKSTKFKPARKSSTKSLPNFKTLKPKESFSRTDYNSTTRSSISMRDFIEKRQASCLIKKHRTKKQVDSFVKSQVKVAKKTLILILIFYCGWGPYALLTFCSQYVPNPERFVTPYTATFSAVFAKAATFLNPIIYTIICSKFRVFLMLNCVSLYRSLKRPK
jgi:hypothetical protein